MSYKTLSLKLSSLTLDVFDRVDAAVFKGSASGAFLEDFRDSRPSFAVSLLFQNVPFFTIERLRRTGAGTFVMLQ